jgi:hypothetical protein
MKLKNSDPAGYLNPAIIRVLWMKLHRLEQCRSTLSPSLALATRISKRF